MAQIKVGDVVRLKSGGPDMTVTSLDGDRVKCAWIDEKNRYQSPRRFDGALLDVVEERDTTSRKTI